MEYVSLNGRTLRDNRAQIPVTDPATAYGFGLFEVTRGYNGIPFRLQDHIQRMKRSARTFGLTVPMKTEQIQAEIQKLCRKNKASDAYIRLTLTGGGNFLVQAHPRQKLPALWEKQGAKLLQAQNRKDPTHFLSGHKTLNYLENVLTRDGARRRGAVDAIWLGTEGEVLEGCVSNIFFVEKDTLITPALHAGILPGVTRKLILKMAHRLGIPLREERVFPTQFDQASEVFITNALIEIMPITKFEKKKVGGIGPITRTLQKEYRKRVEKECR
ncbi:MAG: aminotransferase class IV [Planctomycetota bacterium]|nr:aminotransferase class IV [Planctomycetota bacterium]